MQTRLLWLAFQIHICSQSHGVLQNDPKGFNTCVYLGSKGLKTTQGPIDLFSIFVYEHRVMWHFSYLFDVK